MAAARLRPEGTIPAGIRLRRQWVIAATAPDPALGFREVALSGGWRLHHHQDAALRVIRHEDRSAVLIGVASRDDAPGTPIEIGPALERAPEWLDDVAGQYSLIVDDGKCVTVYTDPAGLGTVYYNDQAAASTPSLLGPLERDSALDAAYRFGGSDNWYPGSITPFRGVRALLANHALTLPGFEARRFWPRSPWPNDGAEQGLDALEAAITSSIANLCSGHSVLASITGGRDSRVNAAALVTTRSRAALFTIRTRHMPGRELRLVDRLVRGLDLPHSYIDTPESTPHWILDAYDEMTSGLSIGGRRDVAAACASLASRDAVHLNGNLGALFLGFYWPSDHPGTMHSEWLLREFVQRPPEILAAVESWLATVPPMRSHEALNLMYFEQRGGRWMGPGERASQLFFDSFTPFASRRVFSILCSLPMEWQRGGRCLVELVRRMRPEWDSIPYCSGTTLLARGVPKPLKVWAKKVLGRS